MGKLKVSRESHWHGPAVTLHSNGQANQMQPDRLE
jgi:hypothetical protein